jgi:hypothetical protein
MEVTHYPPNPTSLDNIYVVTEDLFTSGPCWIDSSNIVINGFDITCNAYFSVGMLAVMCTSFDTFQLGQLPDGTYQFHFNLFMSSTAQIEDSTTIVFTVGSVGMHNTNFDIHGNLYPNPSDGIFIIKIPALVQGEVIIFRIFSLQGRLLKEIEVGVTESEVVIDLSELSHGIYYYDYHQQSIKNYKSGKLIISN